VSVTLETQGPIAWLRMDRPEALNAFDAPMIEQMRRYVAQVAGDRDIRAVVMAGNGRSFCTGVDVKGLKEGSVGLEWFRDWHHMTAELEHLEIPVVAAVQGHCLGGGLMLTLTADYRIAADDLRIGLGAVRHGILPGSAPQRLAGAVGSLAARRLCLFGEYVDAAEALRIGLVDRVVPPVDLDSTAQALADRAASLSPGSLRELKRLLMQSSSLSDEEYETAYLAAQQRCLNTSFLEQPPAPGRQLQEQEAGGAGQSTRPEGTSR
jgi:enoyl-CoA hydratase/carnithine racemase